MSNYPYTLQPIPFELSEAEQRDAQFSLWESTNIISTKTWAIVGAVILASIAGIILTKGYSTAIFWVALVCAILFVVLRIYGMRFYAKYEMQKIPVQAIKGIKIGIQPQGIIMMQRVGVQEGSMIISWKTITEWRETKDYIVVSYQVKGQQGGLMLPKKFAEKKFPIETLLKHLRDDVGAPKVGA